MVRTLIKMALGPYGRAVLAFYEAHSLVINLLVVAYGLLVFACWRNLMSIRDGLVVSMVEGLEAANFEIRDLAPGDILAKLPVDWEGAAKDARLPWVAGRLALWPRRVAPDTLKALIDEEDLVEEAKSHLRR